MGRSPHPKNQMRQKSTFPRLYGRHAVCAALDNPERAFRKLWLTCGGHCLACQQVGPMG